MTTRPTIYYAHAMCLYDHPLEREELRCIRAAFPSHAVINPAAYDDEPGMRADPMAFCYGLIDQAEGVVFSRVLGKITAGVGAEVNYALRTGKEVFELQEVPDGRLLERVVRPVRFINPEASRVLFRRFRAQR